jgi:hypothetical protein
LNQTIYLKQNEDNQPSNKNDIKQANIGYIKGNTISKINVNFNNNWENENKDSLDNSSEYATPLKLTKYQKVNLDTIYETAMVNSCLNNTIYDDNYFEDETVRQQFNNLQNFQTNENSDETDVMSSQKLKLTDIVFEGVSENEIDFSFFRKNLKCVTVKVL